MIAERKRAEKSGGGKGKSCEMREGGGRWDVEGAVYEMKLINEVRCSERKGIRRDTRETEGWQSGSYSYTGNHCPS